MAVPDGWNLVRYSDVLEETNERVGDCEVPILSVTKNHGLMLASERFGKQIHARSTKKYRLAPRGSIVADPMLLWSGTIGLQEIVDAGGVSPDYRVYRPVGDVDTAFMGVLVRSSSMLAHYQTGARGTNVRRNRIARSDFLAIPVKLPPLSEQRKIAAILSSVDEAIQRTQAVIDQVQVVKKALMQELLTRGLPGRHTRFKQTEIGEIPESWEVCPIGKLARVQNGTTPRKSRQDYWEGGTVPWLPTGKVNDRVIRRAEAYVTDRALAETSLHILPRGTVLVAMIGQGKTRGKTAILEIEATTNQNFASIIPGSALDSWFLFFLLEHAYEKLRAGGRGSNQDALNCRILKEYLIPVPNLSEQQSIAKFIGAIEERIDAEAETLDALWVTKEGLASALLSGQVRVQTDDSEAAA